MKSPPSLPKRRRPPDRPMEPEPLPQGWQRNLSAIGKVGFPGFARTFSPAPERVGLRRMLWEGPGPKVDWAREISAGHKALLVLNPAGARHGKKPGAPNRPEVVNRGLWRPDGACRGTCGTTPSERNGVLWSEPGGMRGHPFWMKSAGAVKMRTGIVQSANGSVEPRRRACARRRVLHGHRCKIASGLRVPGCQTRAGGMRIPADGCAGEYSAPLHRAPGQAHPRMGTASLSEDGLQG